MPSLDPIVIWGAGAMGGSIGSWLFRAGHDVVFVDSDEAHVEAIQERGLRITGPIGEFTVSAPCVLPREVRSDLGTVLPCVKAHHTESALDVLAPLLCTDGFIVSVQNGLNERVVADRVGVARTVGCFVNFGADVTEPGIVMRGNHGACVVGELDGTVGVRIRSVHEVMRGFEPGALLTRNIWGYLRGKLAYGSMLFATALADASIAEVLADVKHRPALIGLAREAMAVAARHGVEPEPFDGFHPGAFTTRATKRDAHASLDQLVAFNRRSAKSRSGVRRDLAIPKRKTEVDAQIAPIAALGKALGVEVPLTSRLVNLIHDVEAGRRSQGWDTLGALSGEPART